MRGPRVVKSEQNNAHSLATRECNNLAKIKVEGQNDSRLICRFLEYLAVRHPLESFVAKMDGVVPFDTQPLYNPLSHSHVRKESHRFPLRRMHLFLSQPCGISERLLDVLSFQVRVVRENLLPGCAVCKLTYNDRDRNAHPADAGSSSHDL